jgi:hypothetical protein
MVAYQVIYPLLFLPERPLETDTTWGNLYLIGAIITLGVFSYYLWKIRRRKIVTFWVSKESPLQNRHPLEVSFDLGTYYTAQFRFIDEPNTLLLSCDMPQDIIMLRNKIDKLKIDIDELYDRVDTEYYFAENYYDDEEIFLTYDIEEKFMIIILSPWIRVITKRFVY